MSTERRPIGYWLKYLDRLIEEAFERALAAEGLTRRHWQFLNTVHEAPRTQDGVDAALAPFVDDDPAPLRSIGDELAERGWLVTEGDGTLRLTGLGVEAHNAVERKVADNRRQLVDGITDQEYEATMDTLSRMAANLEAPS